jgi:hypothetical protein
LPVRAGWEKTRPSAPIPHTRNSKSIGTRASRRGWVMDVTPRIFSKLCPDDTGEYEVSAITEVTSHATEILATRKVTRGLLT